jgi:hypothetical protein
MKKIRNIFIAHCGEHEESIENFKKLMGPKSYSFRDSSHTTKDPNKAENKDYIKGLLRDSIRWAGTVIVLIGRDTHENDWIDFEVRTAERFGNKQIIGVYLPSSQEHQIPPALDDYGDALVTWNREKINQALNGEPIWCKPDGSFRPDRDIDRETC